ncbi:phosphate ABC transporter substrate-binding protein [Vibrio cyclitrophicus]|uniref:phosphate ABC transporter substrate-binding protein n=1 Tax=Vibrio cyclitrophicus TaxID=47951 RepID=UPI0032E3EA94
MKMIFSTLLLLGSFNATAGIVVIANSEGEQFVGLTLEDIRRIFVAQQTTLDSGETITVVDLDEGTEGRHNFHSVVTGKSNSELQSDWAKQIKAGRTLGRLFATDYEQVLKAVASDKTAIGYVSDEALDKEKLEQVQVINNLDKSQ